jgi:hypothetical protein
MIGTRYRIFEDSCQTMETHRSIRLVKRSFRECVPKRSLGTSF